MILIKNVSAILDSKTYKESVDIIIKDSRISFIGNSAPEDNYSRIIDGSNFLAMPGFVNTHSHLSMTFMRGYAEDVTLQDWLYKHIFPLEEHLSYDMVYFGTLLAAIESIKTGTTMVADFYFHPQATQRALSEIGMRGNIGIAYASKPFMDKLIIEEVERRFREIAGKDDKILVSLAPHAPYTVSQELLKYTKELQRKFDCVVQTHLHETEKEVIDYMKSYTRTPIEYLASIGFLNEKVVAAHCVWVSENDIKILKKNGVWVSLNPESNMKLGSGLPPVDRFVDSGLKLAVGTDGVASNNNLSVLEAVRIVSLLAKGISGNPRKLSVSDAFDMLTVNGAKALGFNDVGVLKEGFKADLILIRKDSVEMIPMHSPYSNVIYSMYPESTDTVIINGEIVMENRKILTIDEEIVKKEFKNLLNKLIQKE
ncbi:amidohydrolase [Caldisericum exile]|uniref:Hydrolase n=1 Tax=Caldisericum exile (strain DSM 21853 / NBRC 104410 / AZM16c01) TaxID=511051 RepID=A0A7U6GE31_CALEA|nr:amidohydrolase [Caldisericum exile]BAL80622.1 putative hydrolase [Caldisericum exile AZM16c01]